ncbi:MAG TPA: TonB-dependent receptor [Candidatus Acidoferrum sp.]|nr:TonB-dependent receptor [Candidatus Acidoferrum sp.]
MRIQQTLRLTVMLMLPAMSAGARVSANILDKADDQEAKVARAISGAVLDPSGASVAGAKVILTGAGGETIITTTTDSSGAFHFEKIGQGNYQILVQAAGFQESKMDLKVGTKAAAPVQISLAIKEQSEVVTVGATDFSPQVSADVSENQNANTLDRSTLDRVPVFDQDYITTMSRFLDDSSAGTGGVTLIVNGIEANGPGVTPSAVQEVRINQNPYSARFARPGRARLEITMKGGTPNYHGSVNFMFRDSVFDARNTFARVKPGEQRRYYEGSLTGPVGKSKKTTFLLSLDRDEEDQQSIVVAQGVNGPINENVPSPTRHFFGSGRIFHDFANGDQFWIGYSYEQGSNKNVGVGGNVLPEAGTNINFLEHEINVSYRHVFSTKWVNQLRFLVGHFDRPITSLNANPQIVVAGAFTGGGAQAHSRRTEYHFDGTDIVTYVSGKHEMNFGIDVPDISRRGEDDFTNLGGTYTFARLADFEAGRAATFLVQRGQGHLVFLETLLSGFIEDTMRLKPNFSVTVGARYYWQNYFHDEPHNLAPRFGFAYAPTKNSKTVFRGGVGEFFDRSGPRPIADLLHFNGVNLQRFIVESPTFPVTPAELTGLPTSEVVLDAQARTPYTVQYSMGVERQVTEKSTFSATYVGSRGIDLFRSRDINAPAPPNFLARPDATLGQVRQIESEGYQKSNALELTFRGKPSKYFTGQVQYTLGKTYNNTSGITYFPANSFLPSADWARSDNDRRHKFDLLGSMQATKLFTVGAALSLYSGRPVNVTTGGDDNHDGVLSDRPAGFARNTLHGPGTIELDLNVEHDFLLSKTKKEGPRVTVALNAFNVLNHENDTTFIGTITSPFFGRAVSAQPPRRMQLNLQFKF